MNATELLTSYDQNGVLGELTGKTPAELDRFFREAYQDATQALEDARERARSGDREVRLSCFRLSGVNGGDVWVVSREGKATRELQRYPEVERQLLDPGSADARKPPCKSIERARPLLARAAYNGLWSPSGTNWQPIRSVELTAVEAKQVAGTDGTGCGLMVLARRRYESILGDIARLVGFEQASHAEHIDLGIWLLVAEQTARGHGWALGAVPVEVGAGARLQALLAERAKRLPEPSRCAAEEILAGLESDDLYPARLLVPLEGKPLGLEDASAGGLRPSDFDHLVAARSTQRVASPAGELAPDTLRDLFRHALAVVPEAEHSHLHNPVFTWEDVIPALIGQAMHEGIEGQEGLMARASLPRLRAFLLACTDLPTACQAWTSGSEDQLEETGKGLALPAANVPPYICAKLTQGGNFREEDGQLLDHRGRPLTPVRLMKLVRMMARSFGKFFLSFQNTHPLLSMIVADEPGETGRYRAVGRAIAHMTLAARARGQVSIIKSGPMEIAGRAVREILRQVGVSGEPVVTFQVGLPLGPDELVAAGQPGEHDGLRERLLDRRAGRAPIATHYVPVVE